MVIEWSKSFSTGIEWQDRHHKELFKRINKLLQAMNMGLGKDEIGKVFKFLDDYFVVHFEAEEQAMNKYNYPGTLAHLVEHTRFIEDIAKLRKEFEAGVSTGLVIRVQREVVDWLINHIGGVDKEFGAFLKDVEQKKPTHTK
ncbi:MAG: hemerythrin family protein [Deltaproteobacteria bacterium]|nr:hemerythrin family protein [Deltaproteobacteria bacterium]